MSLTKRAWEIKEENGEIVKTVYNDQPSDFVEAMAGVELSIDRLAEVVPKLDAFNQAMADLRDTLQAILSMNENGDDEQKTKHLV